MSGLLSEKYAFTLLFLLEVMALTFCVDMNLIDKAKILIPFLVSNHWVLSFLYNSDMIFAYKTAKPDEVELRILGFALGAAIFIITWLYVFKLISESFPI